MADSGPWDGSDQRKAPQSSRRPQRSLRVSHLSGRSPRRHEGSSRRSRVGSDVGEKVQDLTSSLKATSEVLSTADRMLEHYRYINDDQDEEIRKVLMVKFGSANVVKVYRLAEKGLLLETSHNSICQQ